MKDTIQDTNKDTNKDSHRDEQIISVEQGQADHDSSRDLQHFLQLAAAQVRYRIDAIEKNESYSPKVAQLRLLEELIKEQIPK